MTSKRTFQVPRSIHMIQQLRGAADGAEHHMVPMRDGVRLWTSVYFPRDMQVPAPAILIRTPYAFHQEAKPWVVRWLEQGYVLVFQNERGRYWSEGEYRLFTRAGEDGHDTIAWIDGQSWSNHRVGTYGSSSSGDNQVAMLVHHHPAHRAAIISSTGSSVGDIGGFHEQGMFYRGGAIQMGWLGWFLACGQRHFPKFPPDMPPENRDWLAEAAVSGRWMIPEFDVAFSTPAVAAALQCLPLNKAMRAHGGQPYTDFDDLLQREPSDPAWKAMSLLRPGDQIQTPTLWILQTHDVGVAPNLAAFEYAHGNGGTPQARDHQHMIIAPLGHSSHVTETENTVDGDREIGDARFPYDDTFKGWLDYWLRDQEPDISLPRAQVYVPGRNRWVSFAEWPPKCASRHYYLCSANGARSRSGDGRLVDNPLSIHGMDRYSYDPRHPVPTVGGDCSSCIGTGESIAKPGSYDQSTLELRTDVLVFSSAVISEPFDVLGFAEVIIFVSSDAPDTDFAANLVDVAPDGRAFILSGSIQRARWRDGYAEPHWMEQGKTYKIRIGPFFVCNRFEAGHRIRLDITSSNFPRFDRNLNTGGRNYDESEGRVALNTVHHGAEYPSCLVLPVVRSADE